MELTITRPDDMHLHVRDGARMEAVVPHSAACFNRVVVMPNLVPPVTSVDAAGDYRERIHRAVPPPRRGQFEALMTLYLTDRTDAQTVREASTHAWIVGFKLYPAGATTNSDAGVTRLQAIEGALEAMEEHGVALLVHGEVTAHHVDVFDREAAFIDQVLSDIRERYPRLRIVFEHITTKAAVEFVRSCPTATAATITPQHLLLNRNAMFRGGLRPHLYCLPVLKRERDREALVDAAISADPRFFLGTDSAPHARDDKESACGCAGIYSAHAAIELYAEAFEEAGALDRLEGFASHYGADFYGLPRNRDKITLRRDSWRVPESYPFGAARSDLVPLGAGELLSWRRIGDADAT